MKTQKSDSKLLKYIKNCGIAALFFGAAIFIFACENDIQEIKAFNLTDTLPTTEAQNFETLFTDSGEVRFFLKAPKLLRFENNGKAFVEFPEGMELIKYDKNKVVISSITSDYAKQYEKEQKWEAKNNVVATNSQGDTLKTEHLIWEEESEKIYTDEFVKIIRPDQTITGYGFTSDQSLKNWRIKNPKGDFYVTLDNEGNNNQEQEQPMEFQPERRETDRQPEKGPLQFKK